MIQLSHTFLLLWSQGRIDEALKAYYHIESVKSEALIYGINFHKKLEDEIINNKKIKLGKTELSFENPLCEVKHKVPYNEISSLSGVYDCLDGNTLYEFKSGVQSSLEYTQSYQLGIYFLIAKKLNIEIERGIIVHYNQHEDKSDVSIVYNTNREREKAINFIDSLSYEIYKYFEDNNLPFEKTKNPYGESSSTNK